MSETENNGGGLPEREVIFRETYVYSGADNQRTTETIEYPAPKEDIARLLANAGIDGTEGRTFYIESWDSIIPGIYKWIPDPISFDEMNYLAKQIQALDAGQREIFTAAVEAGLYCGRMEGLINLAANVVKFKLIPTDKQSNVEAGTLTSKGVLVETGEFERPYRWLADIPSEQRATEYLDKYFIPEPAGIVKDVNLSAMLLQMHAVCGDYMADAPDNLATLEALRSAEYLLLIDGRGAYLTEAAHAYREGTPAYDRFIGASDTTDSHAFALHVTDVWAEAEHAEQSRGPIIGDIVSVDLYEQQWDIHVNTVHPTIVDGMRHFEHEDYQAVHRHVERVSNSHKEAERPEPLEPAEFISDLTRSYMAKAEYPQSDKIRISQDAAKEMLVRGDAKVYRLRAGGAECLSRLTVVHNGLNFEKERAFAINPSDMAGFGAWAKRARLDMTRQAQERGEQKKSRGNEI